MDLLERIDAAAQELGRTLSSHGIMCATAESCTGGGIAAAITAVPGSSGWFDRGFVTYAAESKVQLLGVDPQAISSCGVVSGTVAEQMARGALARSSAQAAVSVTGVAGPGGGSPQAPVGTVWFGWAAGGASGAVCMHFDGDRRLVRRQAVLFALQLLTERVRG